MACIWIIKINHCTCSWCIHSKHRMFESSQIVAHNISTSGWCPGCWFNIKMPSYQYRNSHCGYKMILWSPYLHDGISYTGKMISYWCRSLMFTSKPVLQSICVWVSRFYSLCIYCLLLIVWICSALINSIAWLISWTSNRSQMFALWYILWLRKMDSNATTNIQNSVKQPSIELRHVNSHWGFNDYTITRFQFSFQSFQLIFTKVSDWQATIVCTMTWHNEVTT